MEILRLYGDTLALPTPGLDNPGSATGHVHPANAQPTMPSLRCTPIVGPADFKLYDAIGQVYDGGSPRRSSPRA